MRENMKERIRFASIARLSFRGGNIATKVITVILSAFSFMLFALGSTGYTYNEVDYITRGYLNYCSSRSYLYFQCNYTFDLKDQILHIGNECDLELIFPYNENAGGASFTYWNFFCNRTDGIRGNAACSADESIDLRKLFGIEGDIPTAVGNKCLFGSEKGYESLGFELLAGKFPEGKNEIAISEMHFEAFKQYGYYNAANLFIWDEEQEGFTIDSFGGFDSLERIEVEDPADMIGKTLGVGDIQSDGHAYEYTIVGVVDTNYQSEYAMGTGYYPAGRFMLSDEWNRETLYNKDWTPSSTLTSFLYLSPVFFGPITDKKVMKRMVECVIQAREENGDIPGSDYACPLKLDALFHTDQLSSDEALIALIAGCAGTFFLIFAVILNGHLTTISIERKQKEIGILRAMGANKKAVTKIFLLEAFVTATCIFLLALFASLGLYFGWIRAWTSLENFGVSMLVYNGWTVLILAAPCYAVPLLCTIAPLRKFFKRPIIDNITGNSMKKTKKE